MPQRQKKGITVTAEQSATTTRWWIDKLAMIHFIPLASLTKPNSPLAFRAVYTFIQMASKRVATTI